MNAENVIHTHTHSGVLFFNKEEQNNKIMSFSGKRIEVEIMLIQIGQTQKNKYHIFLSCES
jgi:hypothetical protein